jgi:hypothetical protein
VGKVFGVQAVSFPAPAALAVDAAILADAKSNRPAKREEEICLRVIFLRPFKH